MDLNFLDTVSIIRVRAESNRQGTGKHGIHVRVAMG